MFYLGQYLPCLARRAEKVLWCSASLCVCLPSCDCTPQCCISLRGEGNVLHPVLSSLVICLLVTTTTTTTTTSSSSCSSSSSSSIISSIISSCQSAATSETVKHSWACVHRGAALYQVPDLYLLPFSSDSRYRLVVVVLILTRQWNGNYLIGEIMLLLSRRRDSGTGSQR